MVCFGNNMIRPCGVAAAIPTAAAGTPLWCRVTCDGTQIEARCATTHAGLDTAPVAFRSLFESDIRGGHIGFHYGCGQRVDDLTIRSDPDNNGSFSKIEIEEQFNLDAVEMRYDKAGNLTFDGNYTYTYDAWNRQIQVKRAYITKDNTGTKTYHEGSTISTSSYDGIGRRIKKQITNSGDQDYTYVYYYDAQRLIEERNGSDETIKTYAWGSEYIDELVQINTYVDAPQSFWAMQDANYNVLGVVNATGRQVERYEYTPYGQRTIYGRQTILTNTQEAASWANDAMLTYPQLASAWFGSTLPVSLCDFGFQGKLHDHVTDNMYYNARMYSVRHMRMMQTDPMEYIDGPNRLQAFKSNPIRYVDPYGLQTSQATLQPSATNGGRYPIAFHTRFVVKDLARDAIKDFTLYGGASWVDGKTEGNRVSQNFFREEYAQWTSFVNSWKKATADFKKLGIDLAVRGHRLWPETLTISVGHLIVGKESFLHFSAEKARFAKTQMNGEDVFVVVPGYIDEKWHSSAGTMYPGPDVPGIGLINANAANHYLIVHEILHRIIGPRIPNVPDVPAWHDTNGVLEREGAYRTDMKIGWRTYCALLNKNISQNSIKQKYVISLSDTEKRDPKNAGLCDCYGKHKFDEK